MSRPYHLASGHSHFPAGSRTHEQGQWGCKLQRSSFLLCPLSDTSLEWLGGWREPLCEPHNQSSTACPSSFEQPASIVKTLALYPPSNHYIFNPSASSITLLFVRQPHLATSSATHILVLKACTAGEENLAQLPPACVFTCVPSPQ